MPYYIDPNLYFKIVRNMEESFLTDFNMIIEEYGFYQKLTPKMQLRWTGSFQRHEGSLNVCQSNPNPSVSTSNFRR